MVLYGLEITKYVSLQLATCMFTIRCISTIFCCLLFMCYHWIAKESAYVSQLEMSCVASQLNYHIYVRL